MRRRLAPAVAVLVIALAVAVAVVFWPASDVAEGSAGTAPGGSGGSDAERPTGRTPGTAAAAIDLDGGNPSGPRGPDVFASFGWGSGDGQLGRNRPDEANPEAPMSLTIDPQGNVWILDQVNNRLVKLDKTGKVVASVPVPVQGAQDVAVAKDGTVMVLDRLLDESVALLGPDGKPLGELKLTGKNLEEGGSVTGLFSTDDGSVYVEREHGDLVRVGDTKGKADPEQEEVPGRLSRDGTTYLNAGITEPGTDRVYVNAIDRATRAHRYTREFRLGSEAVALTLLDTDRSGIIYLGVLVEKGAPPPPGADPEAPNPNASYSMLITCLDPLDGHQLGRAEVEPNTSADETFRELVVRDEGGVLYLFRTEQGADVRVVNCR